MKSYTDFEQSKILSKILRPETADMYYTPPIVNGHTNYIPHLRRKLPIDWDTDQIIPCWSLTALLSVLPVSCDDEQHCLALINHNPNEKTEWLCAYEDDKGNLMMECYADSQIDACVAMIEKLHELKML